MNYRIIFRNMAGEFVSSLPQTFETGTEQDDYTVDKLRNIVRHLNASFHEMQERGMMQRGITAFLEAEHG